MLRTILVCVAALAACVPSHGQAVTLARKVKDGSALRFKVVSAETFEVEGRPELGIKVNGTAEFTATFGGSGDAGPTAAQVAYTVVERGITGGPEPIALRFTPRDGGKDAGFSARITGTEVFADGWEKGLAGQMPPMVLAAKASPVLTAWQRLSWASLPHRHLQAALPPLPGAPVKSGDNWPAWMYAGEPGDGFAIRLDFNCAVKEIGEKSVKFGQYGKPVLFQPGAAAGAPAAGNRPSFALDAAKSTWSAEVEVSREDGLLLAREGEAAIFLTMTDPAAPGTPLALKAKIWMKVERL